MILATHLIVGKASRLENREFPLVREAHDTPKESLCEHNDEILERIYMGCRFKNDTDRVALRSKSARKTV